MEPRARLRSDGTLPLIEADLSPPRAAPHLYRCPLLRRGNVRQKGGPPTEADAAKTKKPEYFSHPLSQEEATVPLDDGGAGGTASSEI